MLCVIKATSISYSEDYEIIRNIQYYEGCSDNVSLLENKDCRLDLYYPKTIKNYPTVVWLHGGGLTEGDKELPGKLIGKEVAVVSVAYRKSPSVKYPAYIEDAAAALNWTFKNINKYGGSENKIVLSGYSAGAYLALMLALDKKYTKRYDLDVDKLASVVSISGHAVTHFAVRAEQGIPYWRATIDEAAPLYHVRNDACKLVLVVGGREEEMYRRYDENKYLEGMLKLVGHTRTYLYSVDQTDHYQILPYGMDYLLYEIDLIKTDTQHVSDNYPFKVKIFEDQLYVDFEDECEHDVRLYHLEGKELFCGLKVTKEVVIPITMKGIVFVKVDDMTMKYLVQ